MSFLCLLVFSICVLHNSLLTLDVFFTEHGCYHWVGWGEFFALQIQHDCYLSIIFCFLLAFLIAVPMIATSTWLWCDLFRVPRIILILHVFLVFYIEVYDKIQFSVIIDIKSSKLYKHQSKAKWQQADSTNSHYANRHDAKKAFQKGIALKGITLKGITWKLKHHTKRHHTEWHHA